VSEYFLQRKAADDGNEREKTCEVEWCSTWNGEWLTMHSKNGGVHINGQEERKGSKSQF